MKEVIMKVASEKIQVYGLRKFTMDEIANELKISKKTIYKYFKSKDDIINEYFEQIIETDKNSTTEIINKGMNIEARLNSIIYSYHKYKLPISVLDEAYKFYHGQWEKIQKLREFKLKAIEKILSDGVNSKEIRDDVSIKIITLMIESVSKTFLDYKFLSENNMTMNDAMDKVIEVLLHGILNN